MIYNYKSDETVQDVILECFCPLIEDIADEYSTLRRYEDLSIYTPSYIARELIGRILEEIEDVWVHTESHTDLLYNDENEVVITIANDGMIFIEVARGKNGQLKDNSDCTLTYVYDGFSKKDIDILSASGESILVFGFEEDEIEDDTDEDTLVEYSQDKDGDTHGFTVSKPDDNGYSSFSFYSSEELTKEDINTLLKRFGF
ncbi:MAG: hypothetical protein IJA10_10480 [Lachnospiraceae bacterium]|nr:hypothetical protein [Lachnospiraceae bacterium]